MGVFSLCKSCNNLTGSLYGTEYQNFSKLGFEVVTTEIDTSINSVEFSNVYPLRFVKQILSMFCSINKSSSLDDIRKFVLNKDAIGIDTNKYRLCMFFTRSTTRRQYEMLGIIDTQNNTLLLSEIIAYPFGFILYFNADEHTITEGFDITSLCNFGYDHQCNMTMPLIFKEVNTWIPYDYRTKSEIKACIDFANIDDSDNE